MLHPSTVRTENQFSRETSEQLPHQFPDSGLFIDGLIIDLLDKLVLHGSPNAFVVLPHVGIRFLGGQLLLLLDHLGSNLLGIGLGDDALFVRESIVGLAWLAQLLVEAGYRVLVLGFLLGTI